MLDAARVVSGRFGGDAEGDEVLSEDHVTGIHAFGDVVALFGEGYLAVLTELNTPIFTKNLHSATYTWLGLTELDGDIYRSDG